MMCGQDRVFAAPGNSNRPLGNGNFIRRLPPGGLAPLQRRAGKAIVKAASSNGISGMSRRKLRLVSGLSLVAYLLTQTHANQVLAGLGRSCAAVGRSCAAAVTTMTPADQQSTARPCQHCARQAAAGKSERPTAPPADSHAPTYPDSSEHPFAPGVPCPGCPCGDQTCPMPGGCAMCSVAKAPCLTAPPTADWAAPWVGELTFEASLFHVPPLCDGLMRPPRV